MHSPYKRYSKPELSYIISQCDRGRDKGGTPKLLRTKFRIIDILGLIDGREDDFREILGEK